MATGTVTIGVTPCCGVIQRTYEAFEDDGEIVHLVDLEDGRGRRKLKYAPEFIHLQDEISRGVCPDCGKSFEQ